MGTASIRGLHLNNQLRGNVILYRARFLTWGLVDSPEAVDHLLTVLADFVVADELFFPTNKTRTLGKLSATAIKLQQLLLSWRIPRGAVMSTMASLCPGESPEVARVLRSLALATTGDSPAIANFSESFHFAADEVAGYLGLLQQLKEEKEEKEAKEGKSSSEGWQQLGRDTPPVVAVEKLDFRELADFVRSYFR